MNFEVGKYYKHANPCVPSMKILGAVTGSVYTMGPLTLVAESFGDGKASFVGADETSAENWSECAPWVVNEKEANVFEAVEEINDACANHGCMYCGGSGFQFGPRSKCRRGD